MGTVWGDSGGTGPQAALVAHFFQQHLKMVWACVAEKEHANRSAKKQPVF
jgi:hypothetical protein